MADEEPPTAKTEDNAQTATPGRVIGRVLSPDGTPLTGASVAILSPFNDFLLGVHEFARGETDTDGSFEIRIGKHFGTQQRGNYVHQPSMMAPIIAWHPDVGLVALKLPLKRGERGQWVTNAWIRAAADGETVLLKRVSDTGEFEVWQSEMNEATSWSVRADSHIYRATLIQKLPPRLQLDMSPPLEAGSEDADR